LLHAITDALLGALGEPDIGSLFPPTDPQWKGADSVVFLKRRCAGYAMQAMPSARGFFPDSAGAEDRAPRQCDSSARRGTVGLAKDRVGIKAKTPEGIGTDNAAIANAVVLLERLPATAKKSAPAKGGEGKTAAGSRGTGPERALSPARLSLGAARFRGL